MLGIFMLLWWSCPWFRSICCSSHQTPSSFVWCVLGLLRSLMVDQLKTFVIFSLWCVSLSYVSLSFPRLAFFYFYQSSHDAIFFYGLFWVLTLWGYVEPAVVSRFSLVVGSNSPFLWVMNVVHVDWTTVLGRLDTLVNWASNIVFFEQLEVNVRKIASEDKTVIM